MQNPKMFGEEWQYLGPSTTFVELLDLGFPQQTHDTWSGTELLLDTRNTADPVKIAQISGGS